MGSSALGADPFLWALLAALSGGLAAGQALRAFLPLGGEREPMLRKRPSRVSRAIALLAIALLAISALLIFADKTSLASELGAGFRVGVLSGGAVSLLPWACAVAALGLFAGFRPLALGLPLLGLSLLAEGFLSLCLQGWLPFRANASESFEIAHLLPYSVEPSGFSGQLELPERDSVPIAQDLALATTEVCLRVDCLTFAGPFRLAASIVSPGGVSQGGVSSAADTSVSGAVATFSPVLRFYRVVGMASPDGRASLAFAKPRYAALLDAFLGLGSGASGSASALFGLASRSVRSSAIARLIVLEPVTFFLVADGSELRLRPEK
jgi:hypothetical protein